MSFRIRVEAEWLLHLSDHTALPGELELAKGLAAKGKKEEAESMLLRAEADADLSIVLSHGDAEKSEAMAAVERVRQLRRDNQ